MGPHVIVERSGPVRVITMNMPERMNAWNTLLMRDVTDAVLEFFADDDAAVAILTGAGKGFCSGGDRKETHEIMSLASDTERAERLAAWEKERGRFVATVMRRDGPKPFVTAINGPAVGGGLGVAMAGTLRVMADTAFLQETALHIGAGLGGFIHSPLADHYGTLAETENLPAAIENELALGMRISAERAAQIGLVNKHVPAAQLMGAAMEYADYLAQLPREVLREVMENMRRQRRIRRPEMVNNPRQRNTGGAYDEARKAAAAKFAERSERR